ncbi:glycosyl hydrolases 18 family protein [Collimonas arenae]|uniref:chitinase n=1 Tax=Collimonas arenae TaxID=279058 RepID=A0A127QH99_9BURK|nr:glycoside hydrolase family 18 protein [Collimonas arenae]AMP09185.1 glycosyl hydrolases 18 family protein [Collimonas arenae]
MKIFRLSILVAAMLPLYGMAASPSQGTVTQENATDAATKAAYKVVAYYLPSERRYSAADIDPAKLTHLNYAFAVIKNGEVAIDLAPGTKQGVTDFVVLRGLKSRNPRLKTLISVGGWAGSKEFADVALTPQSREKFAASALRFIRQHGFDGVDIDWEFPVAGGDAGNVMRPEDKQNYTLLLQALRDKLDSGTKRDGHRYLLTAAIGNNQGFFQNTEMAKVAAILDWANIMTYDFSGPWSKFAGHVAPLYNDPAIARPDANDKFNVSSTVEMALQAGIPAKKMVLGMPFYGYSWKQCGAARHGQHQDCDGKGRGSVEEGELDFADIDGKLVNQNGFTRYWNDSAKVPYLFNPQTGEFVSYDDVQSLDYKIAYLKKMGLAGAMFWQLSADRNGILLDKVAQELLPR